MTNATARPRVLFGFLFLLGAAVATAALLWWLGPLGNNGDARAFVPVEEVCLEETAYHNVDYTRETFHNGHGEPLRWTDKASFSGQDYHQTSYFDGVAKSEVIAVNGYYYRRAHDDDGNWTAWSVQEPLPYEEGLTDELGEGDGSNPTPGDIEGEDGPVGQVDELDEGTVFCGLTNLVDLELKGHTKIDGIPVRHYAASSDPKVLVDWGLDEENIELWISEEGEIIREYFERLGQEGEGEDRFVYRQTTTWHDHGELNVITAPVIP